VAPGSDGLVMLPYLLGERAPLWDPGVPGAFLGVRHHHTRAHFVRAAVEGVALQLSAIVDGLDQVSPVTSVRATGGVFRSSVWRDILASALDRPLHVTGGAEGSALGAAALGVLAIGRADTLHGALGALAPALVDDDGEAVVPTADPAAYDRVRAAIPGLVDGYREVAALFAQQADRRSGDRRVTAPA
jgi:gluconokinase